MVGMMVADPLNFIGGALAKGASVGIKSSLKGTSIAQDAAKFEKLTSAVQKGGGVVDMLKRFTAASGLYPDKRPVERNSWISQVLNKAVWSAVHEDRRSEGSGIEES